MCLRSHGFGAMIDDSEAETMCLRSHGFEAKEDNVGKETICLRSHGFEAEADASGMMRKTVRCCNKRHMLSGFMEEERKDGMITENDASSDGERARRCDNSVECSIVNAMRGVSSKAEEADRSKNSHENVENASCKLGTGGVVCPSVKNCEVQIVRRQCADCELGTGGVECPSTKVDTMQNAKEQCVRCELGTGRVVCPSAKMQVVNGQCISCKLGVGGVVRPNATEGAMEDDPRRKNHAAISTWF